METSKSYLKLLQELWWSERVSKAGWTSWEISETFDMTKRLVEERINELVKQGDIVSAMQWLVKWLEIDNQRENLLETGKKIISESIKGTNFRQWFSNNLAEKGNYWSRKYRLGTVWNCDLYNLRLNENSWFSEISIDKKFSYQAKEKEKIWLEKLPKGWQYYIKLEWVNWTSFVAWVSEQLRDRLNIAISQPSQTISKWDIETSFTKENLDDTDPTIKVRSDIIDIKKAITESDTNTWIDRIIEWIKNTTNSSQKDTYISLWKKILSWLKSYDEVITDVLGDTRVVAQTFSNISTYGDSDFVLLIWSEDVAKFKSMKQISTISNALEMYETSLWTFAFSRKSVDRSFREDYFLKYSDWFTTTFLKRVDNEKYEELLNAVALGEKQETDNAWKSINRDVILWSIWENWFGANILLDEEFPNTPINEVSAKLNENIKKARKDLEEIGIILNEASADQVVGQYNEFLNKGALNDAIQALIDGIKAYPEDKWLISLWIGIIEKALTSESASTLFVGSNMISLYGTSQNSVVISPRWWSLDFDIVSFITSNEEIIKNKVEVDAWPFKAVAISTDNYYIPITDAKQNNLLASVSLEKITELGALWLKEIQKNPKEILDSCNDKVKFWELNDAVSLLIQWLEKFPDDAWLVRLRRDITNASLSFDQARGVAILWDDLVSFYWQGKTSEIIVLEKWQFNTERIDTLTIWEVIIPNLEWFIYTRNFNNLPERYKQKSYIVINDFVWKTFLWTVEKNLFDKLFDLPYDDKEWVSTSANKLNAESESSNMISTLVIDKSKQQTYWLLWISPLTVQNAEKIKLTKDTFGLITQLSWSRAALAEAFLNIGSKSLLRFLKTSLQELIKDDDIRNLFKLVMENKLWYNESDIDIEKFISLHYDLETDAVWYEHIDDILEVLYATLQWSSETAAKLEEAMYQFLEQDRTKVQRKRIMRLKEMNGLMKIINANPILSEKFKSMHIPSNRFKHETETSMSGNIHHRQLTSFMSSIAREPTLRRLFHDEALRLARQRSKQLWSRIKENWNKISLSKLRVWLWINWWIMAETESRLYGDSIDDTLYIGKENYFWWSFNIGWSAEKWFMTNSRNRAATTTNPMYPTYPTYPWSINHPGMFSILWEADMHSSMYSGDNDRWFEALSKFSSVNYLMDAELITHEWKQWEWYTFYIKNKNDGSIIEIEANDMSYLTGLWPQKRWFSWLNKETLDIIDENRLNETTLKKEFNEYKASKDYRDPNIVPIRQLENFPRYMTWLDFIRMAKNPSIDLHEILRWANVWFIWKWDTAKVWLEHLYVHGSNTPRQTIQLPKTFWIWSNYTKESLNSDRPRYSLLAPFMESEKDIDTDVKIFSVNARSEYLKKRSNWTILLWLDGRINNTSDLTTQQSEYLLWNWRNDNELKLDLVIDCSGLDLEKWINSVLHTVPEIILSRNEIDESYIANEILSWWKIWTKIFLEDDSELIFKNIVPVNNPEVGIAAYAVSLVYLNKEKKSYEQREIYIDGGLRREMINSWTDFFRKLETTFANDIWTPVRLETYVSYDNTWAVWLKKANQEKQKEVLKMVFWDKKTDDVNVYRAFPDSIWTTTFQGPPAKLPFSNFEEKLLNELGIDENFAARFRYHFRIYAQAIEDYRKRLVNWINSPKKSNLLGSQERRRIKWSDQKWEYTKSDSEIKIKWGELARILKEWNIPQELSWFMNEKILWIIMNELVNLDIEKVWWEQSFDLTLSLYQVWNNTNWANLFFKPENKLTWMILDNIWDDLISQEDIVKYIALRLKKKMWVLLKRKKVDAAAIYTVEEKIKIPLKKYKYPLRKENSKLPNDIKSRENFAVPDFDAIQIW